MGPGPSAAPAARLVSTTAAANVLLPPTTTSSPTPSLATSSALPPHPVSVGDEEDGSEVLPSFRIGYMDIYGLEDSDEEDNEEDDYDNSDYDGEVDLAYGD
jgi:hypothetical protein